MYIELQSSQYKELQEKDVRFKYKNTYVQNYKVKDLRYKYLGKCYYVAYLHNLKINVQRDKVEVL